MDFCSPIFASFLSPYSIPISLSLSLSLLKNPNFVSSFSNPSHGDLHLLQIPADMAPRPLLPRLHLHPQVHLHPPHISLHLLPPPRQEPPPLRILGHHHRPHRRHRQSLRLSARPERPQPRPRRPQPRQAQRRLGLHPIKIRQRRDQDRDHGLLR